MTTHFFSNGSHTISQTPNQLTLNTLDDIQKEHHTFGVRKTLFSVMMISDSWGLKNLVCFEFVLRMYLSYIQLMKTEKMRCFGCEWCHRSMSFLQLYVNDSCNDSIWMAIGWSELTFKLCERWLVTLTRLRYYSEQQQNLLQKCYFSTLLF